MDWPFDDPGDLGFFNEEEPQVEPIEEKDEFYEPLPWEEGE